MIGTEIDEIATQPQQRIETRTTGGGQGGAAVHPGRHAKTALSGPKKERRYSSAKANRIAKGTKKKQITGRSFMTFQADTRQAATGGSSRPQKGWGAAITVR